MNIPQIGLKEVVDWPEFGAGAGASLSYYHIKVPMAIMECYVRYNEIGTLSQPYCSFDVHTKMTRLYNNLVRSFQYCSPPNNDAEI